MVTNLLLLYQHTTDFKDFQPPTCVLFKAGFKVKQKNVKSPIARKKYRVDEVTKSKYDKQLSI